jgi:integrase
MFLRVKKSDCAPSTYNIYCEVGERHIVPKLTEATGDDMNSITAQIIRDILNEYDSGHEPGGTNFIYRHLKSFVNWYWNEYELSIPNPMKGVKGKKDSLPPKEGLTHEEVDKLLRAAKGSRFPERDTALIMLLCDTGIRKSSIEMIRMQDVDLTRNEVLVFEKDQQYHTKAFGNATAKALRKYLLCVLDSKPTDPFWLQMDGRALTRVGMREVIRRLCTAAGIPQHEFHDFRRYYGKTLYDSTHDIYLVSRALDHKDIYVTKRYIAIDDREDAESMRSHSPMDLRLHQTGAIIQR